MCTAFHCYATTTTIFFGTHNIGSDFLVPTIALQPTMPRPITTGALVVVKPCQKVGKRDSEGGCGVVVKKKRQNMNESVVKILTQTLTVSMSGDSLFDIKYNMGWFLQRTVHCIFGNYSTASHTYR